MGAIVGAMASAASDYWKDDALADWTRERLKSVDRQDALVGDTLISLMRQSRERLILRRDTHLDQLADKLREDRVRRVVQPMLQGEELPVDVPEDDRQYCIDLGLIARRDRQLQVANRIYREVLPRELTSIVQDSLQGKAEQPEVWGL